MSNYSPHFSSPFSASSPHSLFGLSKKEKVVESFTCTLWSKIFIPGHVYFTESNIYFYGETFGHENKIIISYAEINHINKAKSLGPQTDSIEIHTKSQEDYDFTGFRDVDKAYEVVMMLSQRSSSIESDHVASLDTFDGSRARAYSEDSPKEPQGEIVNYEADKNKTPQETLKVGLPLSMDKFFDVFFSDEAVLSYAQSMELNGASDVELTKWRPSQEADNITIKEMTMIVKVHGVPLKSKARVQAVLTCTKKNNEIQINIAKKTLDIPYSDAFQIEEKWSIQTDEVSAERCILTNTADTVFSKKVGVENIIRSRTYDSVKAEHDLWLKIAKSRHLFVESEYQYSTPLLSPIKEKTSEKEKSKNVINNDNKNQVSGEHLQQGTGRMTSNVQRNKGLRSLIFILILLIIFLMISVVILYSKLGALETKFTNMEKVWKRDVFDDSQEF